MFFGRKVLPPGLAKSRLALGIQLTACLCGLSALLLAAHSSEEMTTSYRIGDAQIDVQLDSGALRLSDQDLMQWVHWASDSVTTYYGRFPVPNFRLRIIPTGGQGVRGGTTFGDKDGGFTRIHVGQNSTMADLQQDWMLTHEMVHLAFPSVAREHHWIEEGTATYVEPIARVRAGHLDAQQMWFELAHDLHQGLRQPGDQGLDNTHTWANTYWGGALFCFLADVEIHKQTKNRKGLDDALRGILNAGGNISRDWKLTDALRTGDEATGVAVLLPLYEKMKDQPYQVDLPAMWRDLGVERTVDTVRFVDSAPLADTRKAITFGEATSGKAAPGTIGKP